MTMMTNKIGMTKMMMVMMMMQARRMIAMWESQNAETATPADMVDALRKMRLTTDIVELIEKDTL